MQRNFNPAPFWLILPQVWSGFNWRYALSDHNFITLITWSYHCAKRSVTTMLTYSWKCTVLHCNHLGNTWKPLVLMTQHFDYCPSASKGDNQSVRSSPPVVSRCFPGGYNVKLYISRSRLAWWLLAFLCCDMLSPVVVVCIQSLFDLGRSELCGPAACGFHHARLHDNPEDDDNQATVVHHGGMSATVRSPAYI